MIIRSLLLCALLAPSMLFAAPTKLDSLTVGATTYQNVTVLGANKTDLYFTSDKGIANVKLKYLAPDMQKQFGYDPKAAAEAELQKLEQDAQYHHSLAAATVDQARQATQAAQKAAAAAIILLADPVSDTSLLGKAGPAVKVDKWLGDPPDLNGKYVLVSFWAPWSGASRTAIHDLNALQKKFADKLAVVGVTTDTEANVTAMTEPKVEYPLGLDAKSNLVAAAGVTSIPCVLLLDPNGIVRYVGHPAAVTEAQLKTILAPAAQ